LSSFGSADISDENNNKLGRQASRES